MPLSGIIMDMNTNLPPLIRALLEPQRYSDATTQVEWVQTHISWVLLAGDFAYKIKKPLHLPFLDFSTLAQRRHYCEEELRLNRRFAPDLYLAVVPIFNTAQDPQFKGLGEPIEYAVKMRRFEEAGRLDRVCARGELQPLHLSHLADRLTTFHAGAAIAAPTSRFGSDSAVMTPARDNFTDLLRLLPEVGMSTRLTALQAWTEAQFKQLAPLMAARKIAGRVRECHGDLHLANMVLIDQHVEMFDCIEFNEDFRWIDVASEIAFTYVDLIAHAQPGLADWFLDEVLSRSGDYEAALLVRFYGVYRALVRAKIAAIRMTQTAPENPDEAAVYIALAERLVASIPVQLIITHGLSGCGKTVASHKILLEDTQAATLRLRSDVERKRLFGLTPLASSHSTPEAGIYNPLAHAQTYAHLRTQAERLLRAGWSVIVDAAFLKRADRDTFRTLAAETGAAFSILAPQATPAQLRARIQARQALEHAASEATLEVLAQQMQTIEPLQADERQLAQTSA